MKRTLVIQKSAAARAFVSAAAAFVVGAVAMLFDASAARAVIIDFGSGNSSLPYSEDGFTITDQTAFPPGAIVAGGGILGAPNLAFSFRTASQPSVPFDLVSIQVLSSNPGLHVTSSSGGTFTLPGPGIANFTAVSGFQHITYFDLGLNSGGNFQLDNFVINFVPEPSGWQLALAAGLVAGGWWLVTRVGTQCGRLETVG